GRWVLASACAQIARWRGRAGLSDLTLAVNVSAREFRHPGFVDHVLRTLDATRIDATRLKLELTESILADDVDAVVRSMSALKARGVQFSLDDFGTGFSSLAYLQRMPLDQLKIDQSFVRSVVTSASDASIVRTVIALGRGLGLEVIAEGVETEAQRAFLADSGCDRFQGYLFGRPVPVDEFERGITAD
nr:EAL domain-containing protein [Quisquiliibacterium sp.]